MDPTKNLKEVDHDVEFVLIGAGLPRTGTLSTWTALEQLLPGKCHHMLRAFMGPNDDQFWSRASRGELTDTDWKEFIRTERLSAEVDYPMSLYWRDLVRLYPNAKVLLTVRDPVRWYQSVNNTIRQIVRFMTESWLAAPLRLASRLTGKGISAAKFTCFAPTHLGPRYPLGMFGAVDAGQETAVRFFNEWRDQVVATVPAERLLVWEVKEGWAPLCNFLSLPIPNTPFPNVNDTAQQQARLRATKLSCAAAWTVICAGLATAAFFLQEKLPSITLIWP